MSSDTEKEAGAQADRMEDRLDELSQHIDEAKKSVQDNAHTEEEPPTGEPPDTEAQHPQQQ
jgi:uncharacterized coiled-coil protein SlyX